MITSSIVIYNKERTPAKDAELTKVIESASASVVEKIYVIDNSPEPIMRDFVKALSPKIEYIFNDANLGYGGAHNIAIRKSIEQGAKYHVVLNPDIYFEEGVIESLAYYMDSDDTIGAVMPQVEYPNGETQYLCKLQATPLDLFGRRFIPFKGFVEKRNRKYELRDSGYNKTLNIPCLSGCFMFLRNSALQDVGLFDDDFFMYCEDFDLYKRIHQKYRTMFYPLVTVIHDHKKESYKSKKMMILHIKSAIKYFNKWGWFFDKDRKISNNRILKEIRTQL